MTDLCWAPGGFSCVVGSSGTTDYSVQLELDSLSGVNNVWCDTFCFGATPPFVFLTAMPRPTLSCSAQRRCAVILPSLCVWKVEAGVCRHNSGVFSFFPQGICDTQTHLSILFLSISVSSPRSHQTHQTTTLYKAVCTGEFHPDAL